MHGTQKSARSSQHALMFVSVPPAATHVNEGGITLEALILRVRSINSGTGLMHSGIRKRQIFIKWHPRERRQPATIVIKRVACARGLINLLHNNQGTWQRRGSWFKHRPFWEHNDDAWQNISSGRPHTADIHHHQAEGWGGEEGIKAGTRVAWGCGLLVALRIKRQAWRVTGKRWSSKKCGLCGKSPCLWVKKKKEAGVSMGTWPAPRPLQSTLYICWNANASRFLVEIKKAPYFSPFLNFTSPNPAVSLCLSLSRSVFIIHF